MIKIIVTLSFIVWLPLCTLAQINLQKPFLDCQIKGSITLYDYKGQKWIFSDKADSQKETLPASTFKIINSLIALETGVIADENKTIEWVGEVDTILYGYRPDIYKNLTMKEAFEQSAGWVYIELAKKIGKEQYQSYLRKCNYGNIDLSEKDVDFWNFGSFGISPINQITFLKDFYEEKLPFSKRTYQIVKRIMVAERAANYTISAKTGWTRYGEKDIGWWVGYLERKDNVYFFATRLTKERKTPNPNFAQCRKEITKSVLRQLKAME